MSLNLLCKHLNNQLECSQWVYADHEYCTHFVSQLRSNVGYDFFPEIV